MPHFVGDFTAYELAIVGMYFIALLGLSILTGFGGQISLGHGAFMAIGGYTTAILSVDHGVRDLWTIPIAGLSPARRVYWSAFRRCASPALPGADHLRHRRFLAAAAEAVRRFLRRDDGDRAEPRQPALRSRHNAEPLAVLPTWGIALVLLAVAWIFLRGRPGRALQAVRDSEVAAASSGVNLATYKTLAFGISAFYAGVAGALYVMSTAYMNPDVFPIVLSVYLVAALAIGGLDSLVGLIAGAAVIYVLQNRSDDVTSWLNHLPILDLNPKQPGMPSVVFGVVLIAVMIALPTGLGGFLRRIFQPLTSRLYSRS